MTEQLHTISIPGLPDGWRAVAYRYPKEGEYFLWEMKPTLSECDYQEITHLIIEKIQPRRIVLEETEEFREAEPGEFLINIQGFLQEWSDTAKTAAKYRIWRVVEDEK